MDSEHLQRNLVLRLVRYARILRNLKNLGLVRVFSNNLGDALGVTATVVRKDFAHIGITGNKRGGYEVDDLLATIRGILAKKDDQPVVVVGCGRIGSALMEYGEFAKDGIRIVGGFDADPQRCDGEHRPPIYPIDELAQRVPELGVEVAVLTVPDSAALAVFEQLLKVGVCGFLNFTSVDLRCSARSDKGHCPYQCTVQNVNVSLELDYLFSLVEYER